MGEEFAVVVVVDDDCTVVGKGEGEKKKGGVR
jgi:hypothetical protein